MASSGIGNRLKELRNMQGKTQDEVAKSIGISRARYSHLENERNEPDNELLKLLASYYEVSTIFLEIAKKVINLQTGLPRQIVLI